MEVEIRKELKELSMKLKSEGHPNYHNDARSIINKKYGNGWRESNLKTDNVKMNYF